MSLSYPSRRPRASSTSAHVSAGRLAVDVPEDPNKLNVVSGGPTETISPRSGDLTWTMSSAVSISDEDVSYEVTQSHLQNCSDRVHLKVGKTSVQLFDGVREVDHWLYTSLRKWKYNSRTGQLQLEVVQMNSVGKLNQHRQVVLGGLGQIEGPTVCEQMQRFAQSRSSASPKNI
eukprot:SAG31_NODE_86_length_26973_cov_16.850897_35_plen_174_part_00